MYKFVWHKSHGDKTSSSAAVIVGLLGETFEISSVLDIGCGDGRWLRSFQDRGASRIRGVDGPWTDRDRLLIGKQDFTVHNLEKPLDLAQKFDLAMSLEVAEHVHREFSDQFVGNLTRHADLVLFGAAIPYQGGFRHVNEQWPSYWAEKFAAAGFRCFDLVRPLTWDRDEVFFWYKQNCLIYIRQSRADLIERIEAAIGKLGAAPLPMDIIHPELYQSLASYRQIAFRPLLRELPVQMVRKARAILTRNV
jgi:SAM-dependent methyltransferase